MDAYLHLNNMTVSAWRFCIWIFLSLLLPERDFWQLDFNPLRCTGYVSSNVGLNPDWAHFTGLSFPSLSLLAELHKDKALIWKSIPHTRLSQQHTGFHYVEQVASAGRSATLRNKVGGFGGPRRLPVPCQKVNLSVFHCSCRDYLTDISFSLPCLTPFPLTSYMFNRTKLALFGWAVSPDCSNISKSEFLEWKELK